MESHAKTAVVAVTVTVVLGALLFAISFAVIKVHQGKMAGLAPPAHPATDTAGHSENDYEEHQYEDCSYDSQPHVYENDEDLQEGVVTDEADTMNHVYDNCINDNDHLASKPTDRVSSPEIPENKTSEVVDQDPASQEGAQDGGLEQEEEHTSTSEAFADVATGSMDGGSNQQRAEGPPVIPSRMAAMTTDGGIADDVGTENVCAMKGNDTYEAAV
uniref:Uncharacterized protein n=1 Tax=Branchiostoma floridae TaxID=7739 RepID=C3ZNF4_BRAFL|eukprot:XP_002589896.1 hypothetical protein BRAFLDRAFT_81976 [Branchiostoma floridae]